MIRSAKMRASSLVLVGLGLVLFARPAFAAPGERMLAPGEPATSRVLQLGLGGEYGAKLAGPALNPWAFGLGVHVGYTLPMGVYFGVPFDYFFGTTDEAGQEAKLWHIGVEGGYDLALRGEVVLRLKGGLGFASESHSRCAAGVCTSGTDSALAFGPGLAFLYLGPNFSFTLDARYQLIPLDPLAQGLLFSIGIGF